MTIRILEMDKKSYDVGKEFCDGEGVMESVSALGGSQTMVMRRNWAPERFSARLIRIVHVLPIHSLAGPCLVSSTAPPIICFTKRASS